MKFGTRDEFVDVDMAMRQRNLRRMDFRSGYPGGNSIEWRQVSNNGWNHKETVMKYKRSNACFIAALAFFPGFLAGQSDIRNTLPTGIETMRVVAGKISTPKGDPVSHASVGIQNNAAAPYRVVQTDKDGEYRADYYFREETEAIKHFTVTLMVTKKGFQPSRRYVEIPPSLKVLGIPVTLRPIMPEDANQLSQADLIKGLTSKLRQLTTSDGLAAASEKDYLRGVQDFLDRNHIERAIPVLSKVARSNPTCLRCRTMLALAELAWGDWDDARRELGESVNALIEDPKLACPEPLIAYGVLLCWDKEPDKASSYLGEALKSAPEDPLALQEYGRAQCQNMNWEVGNEFLGKALAAGAGPDARLLRAEALLWAGTPDEANAELTRYLEGREIKSLPPRVRTLAARIQDRKKDDAAFVAANAKARAKGEEAVDYINHPPQDLPDFEPAADQAPLEAILDSVGKNVAKLFASLPNISAVENVEQEKLSNKGKPGAGQKHEYRYLCLPVAERWGPVLDEYRSDAEGKQLSQPGLQEGFMLTAGFLSGPLVFHPAYQGGSSFRLLGTQKLRGHTAFVIAFAQNPARSRIFGTFQDGKDFRMIHKQGLAWVDSENFQIIRLMSDLLRPVPQAKLNKINTEINFSEVTFSVASRSFWLPGSVTVTMDWNGKGLRNRHAYSDFMVFNVDSKEKLGDLKAPANVTQETEKSVPPANTTKSVSPSKKSRAANP
jgi:tetratricopeptide (TPR) repeat protein